LPLQIEVMEFALKRTSDENVGLGAQHKRNTSVLLR